MKLLRFLALKSIFVAALFASHSLVALGELYASEAGYSEAMQYFVKRKKMKRLQLQASAREPSNQYMFPATPTSSSKASVPAVLSNKRAKYFISLGMENGRSAFDDARLLELGVSLNDYKWIQSNLSLEWRSIFGKSGDSVAFMYSVQPSTVLFFLGPEIGFGAGRSWVVGDGESFTSLKLGLNVSNRWSKKYLAALNVYYRRDQGIRDSFHDDRVGASLRFGF